MGTWAAFLTKSGHDYWRNFATHFARHKSGTPLLQILHPPLREIKEAETHWSAPSRLGAPLVTS